MALPTMRGYWSSRKNMYEQAISRHREHESQHRSQWKDTASYFHNSSVLAAKQNAWSSEQVFQNSMEAYNSAADKDLKSSRLQLRREKLAGLLSQENVIYEAELKGKGKSSSERLQEMRLRVDGLKSSREEARQKVAEDKLYQHWRQNDPSLRQVERDLLQEHVSSGWDEQLVDKQQRLETARKEKESFEKQQEEERQTAIQRENQAVQDRLQKTMAFRTILKEQMEQLKKREHEAEELRIQEDDLLRQQWRLEQIQEEQRRKEKEQEKKELGRTLLRQHKAQMMNRSRVIQQELEQDRKLLESLLDQEHELTALQTARREKARADAQWMRQVIEDQLRVEKVREAELDLLYQDEAARVWHQREAEWTRERLARQRLMQEVLATQQSQITEKLKELQRQQEESLIEREELVREMEQVQETAQAEERDQQLTKRITREDLKEQIRTQQEQEKQQKKELALELEEAEDEEVEYLDLLQQETERLRLQGYTPRYHGRKPAWL